MQKQTAEELIRSFTQILKGQVKLFFLEFALARYSLVPLLFLLLLFIIAAAGVWLSLLCLAAYFSYHYSSSIIVSLLVTFVLSMGSVGIILIWLKSYFKQLAFTKTRQMFHQFKQNNHEQNIAVKESN